MSEDNPDAVAVEPVTQPSAGRPRRRGWWSRNWRWFVPTLLLTTLVLCGGGVLGFYLFNVKPLRLEPYPTGGMQLVQKDARVIDRLGQPIRNVTLVPSGERNVNGGLLPCLAVFRRGRATRDGHTSIVRPWPIDDKWGFSQLDVTFASGERIRIDTDLGEGRAPPLFHGTNSE